MSDYIPEAVLEQILLRLPPTALVRLSSVCKAWHSLITSPSFISSHLQRSLSNDPLLLTRIRNSPQWTICNIPRTPISTITQPPRRYSLRFVQSLHGLVCLCEQDTDAVILWNPSIRRHITLQIPSASPDALGFGFDSKNNDFKVISMFYPGKVQLYSLNNGAWKVLHGSLPLEQKLGVPEFSATPCFFNGNVHWFMEYCSFDSHRLSLLMFDVEEEKFKEMAFPPALALSWLCNLHITVIEGCLSVLRYSDCENQRFDGCSIWMMREYGVAESWTKIPSLKLGGRVIKKVIGLRTSTKVLVLEQKAKPRSVSLFSFDTKSQEVMNLGMLRYKLSAWEYTQSLVLLDREMPR